MPEPAARPPQPNGRSSYIPGLDGIRAIAFLLVFWAHALPGVSRYIPATLGVTIFFFLSGYLITTLLRKELARTGTLALGDFYMRRTLRIFIPLYVVYTLDCLLTHFWLHQSVGNRFGFLSLVFYFYNYAAATGWKAWLPPGMIVVWSLGVEEHFYLLFPAVLLWMNRRRVILGRQTRYLTAFCAATLVWRIVLVTVFHDHHGWTYFATDARLDSILWGAILALRNNPVAVNARAACDPSILPTRFPGLAALGGLLALGTTLLPQSHLYKETFRYTLQALCLYVLFSYIIPHTRRPVLAWLEWTPLRYLGWISYALYLCHDFLLTAFQERYPGRLALSAPLSFVLAIGFATLLRYTLELPLQRLRARYRSIPEADPSAPDGHGLIS